MKWYIGQSNIFQSRDEQLISLISLSPQLKPTTEQFVAFALGFMT